MATLAEQLAKLLADNGISIADVQAAMAVPAPVQAARPNQRQRGFRASMATATRPAYTPKYTYGTAPSGLVTARETHKARLAALEAAMPGFKTVAYVFSVGKNAQGQLEKHLDAVVNQPWTWIELPSGKEFKHGNLTPDQVRATLASLGYGFSPSNGLWATDGNGKPVRRIRHYQAQQAGKNMVNMDE